MANAARGTEASPADAPDGDTPAIALSGAPNEAPADDPTGALADDPTGSPDRNPPTRGQRVWRWAARAIALVTLVITVMLVALTIGMRSNDAAIDERLGTATATVISLSLLSTGIEFVDATGATVRPEGGVLYPGLLALGQQFVIEYDTQNPQIARVAGRTASVGMVMIGVTAGVTYLIALPLIWWCRRRSHLPLTGLRRDPGHATPPGNPAST